MPVLEKWGESQQTERSDRRRSRLMFIAICVEYSYRCFLLILRAVIGDTSSAMPLSEPFFEMLSASSSWLALLESSGAQAA